MKNFWLRRISVIFFSFFILIIFFSSIPAEMFNVRFNEVKSFGSNLVFSFQIITSIEPKYLENDEYILYDEIESYDLYILYLSSDINLSSVEITLTSPSMKEYTYKIEKNKWMSEEPSVGIVSTIPRYIFPSRFEETGIWFIEFHFSANKPLAAWEYTGYFFDFKDDSEVRSPSYISQNSYFKKGITIYSQPELLQLRAAKATEETANSYQISIIVLIATAIGTFIAASVSAYSVHVSIKERKKPAIRHMIDNAIHPAILEFKELKEKVERIKIGHIINLISNNLNESDFSQSHWLDFRTEFEEEFFKIWMYVGIRDHYNEIRENCRIQIIESLKRIKINKKINTMLIDMKKNARTIGTLEEFFQKDIVPDLADNVLCNEKLDNKTDDLFIKFEQKWLKVRQENNIKIKLDELIEYASKLSEYQKLENNLEKNRKHLINKYYLTYWDFEEHRRELKKSTI